MNRLEPRLWSFYTPDDALFLRDNYIALDDRFAFGDLSSFPAERDAFRACFDGTVTANVLYRFVHELQIGDCVLLRTEHGAPVELGRVTGDYAYVGGEHRRSVRWLKRLLFDDISSGAMRELSYASASPLFEVKRYANEFFAMLGLCVPPAPQGGTAAERFAARWSAKRKKTA